jgi:hypothetical protein
MYSNFKIILPQFQKPVLASRRGPGAVDGEPAGNYCSKQFIKLYARTCYVQNSDLSHCNLCLGITQSGRHFPIADGQC